MSLSERETVARRQKCIAKWRQRRAARETQRRGERKKEMTREECVRSALYLWTESSESGLRICIEVHSAQFNLFLRSLARHFSLLRLYALIARDEVSDKNCVCIRLRLRIQFSVSFNSFSLLFRRFGTFHSFPSRSEKAFIMQTHGDYSCFRYIFVLAFSVFLLR